MYFSLLPCPLPLPLPLPSLSAVQEKWHVQFQVQELRSAERRMRCMGEGEEFTGAVGDLQLVVGAEHGHGHGARHRWD